MKQQELLFLIAAAQRKEPKAQSQLINQFWVQAFTFILKKVNNETDADELTVQVFAKILGKLELYDPNFEFRTWILTIAQNTVIDYWRKNKQSTVEFSDYINEQKNRIEKSPEELLISQEEQKKILKTIHEMDSHYREIIELRFFEEKSIKEIAESLNISIANTKVRIMRAKKILAKLLIDSHSTLNQ